MASTTPSRPASPAAPVVPTEDAPAPTEDAFLFAPEITPAPAVWDRIAAALERHAASNPPAPTEPDTL